MTRRPYVTSQRLEDVQQRLTDHDREVLTTLRKVRVATGLQLQRIHHGVDHAAQQRRIRQLNRLARWQLVTRLNRRIGGLGSGSVSSVYCLDVAGLRLLDLTGSRARQPWTPSTPFVAHGLAVTELYVGLIEATRAGTCELVDFTAEPKCWRPFTGRHGDRVTLKPDAHAVVAAGEFEHHWFIEVDRATEARPRILTKAKTYLDYHRTGIEQDQHDVFPRVLWVAPDERRTRQLAEVLDRLATDDRSLFSVTTDPDAIASLTGKENPT